MRKLCLLLCLLLLALPALSLAESYQIIVQDDADLLTDAEELLLRRDMAELSAYGTVAFWSTNERGSVDDKAERFFDRYIGTERSDSGVVFMVDMYNHEIYIFTRGLIEQRVGRAGAYAITDNVYEYATNKEYARCATEGFAQVLRLVEGQRIFSPMRMICNLLLALNLALVGGYIVIRRTSVHASPARRSDMLSANTTVNMSLGSLVLVSTRRHLRESSSGGSHGGGGFHGGGGGGFHGGGGGGHSAGGSGGGHRF